MTLFDWQDDERGGAVGALGVGVIDARWSGSLLGGSLRRLALVVAGVAGVLALFGPAVGLSIPRVDVGDGSSAAALVAAESETKPTFDVDRAIERVRHEIVPVAGEPGVLGVSDSRYQARFAADVSAK